MTPTEDGVVPLAVAVVPLVAFKRDFNMIVGTNKQICTNVAEALAS